MPSASTAFAGSAGKTVTLTEAETVLFLSSAVIVTLSVSFGTEYAWRRPPTAVTELGCDDVHTRDLSVAFSGEIVEVTLFSSPTFKVTSDSLNAIYDTGIISSSVFEHEKRNGTTNATVVMNKLFFILISPG